MAIEIEEIKIEVIKDENITSYIFELDGNTYKFDIVKFKDIREYDSLKEKINTNNIDIFRSIQNKDDIKNIVSFDWNVIELKNKKVNIFVLMRICQIIGGAFSIENEPDIIFYYAENERFHNIYKKLFEPYFWYNLIDVVDKHYVYLKIA